MDVRRFKPRRVASSAEVLPQKGEAERAAHPPSTAHLEKKILMSQPHSNLLPTVLISYLTAAISMLVVVCNLHLPRARGGRAAGAGVTAQHHTDRVGGAFASTGLPTVRAHARWHTRRTDPRHPSRLLLIAVGAVGPTCFEVWGQMLWRHVLANLLGRGVGGGEQHDAVLVVLRQEGRDD